jgi:transketolase
MALSARIQGRDNRVFVLLGDGELHEGQVWEAALGASDKQTGLLIAIVDRNKYSLDGRVEDVLEIEPLAEKWAAFGWNVREVDGHDVPALLAVLSELGSRDRTGPPSVVIAHTIKGKGVRYMEETPGWHLGYLAAPDEEAALREVRNGP